MDKGRPTAKYHLFRTNRVLILMNFASVEPKERPHLCYGGVWGAETCDDVDGGWVLGGGDALGDYVARSEYRSKL